MKIAEWHEGTAEQVPTEYREAQKHGQHLRITRIEDVVVGVFSNPTIENAQSADDPENPVTDIRITVWFGDQMIDLTMDPDTRVHWEVWS